jgi:SanA protein
MSKKYLKKIKICTLVIVTFVVIVNLYIIKSTSEQIFYEQKNLPEKQVALLLGAKVYNNGNLSHIMQDRAETAIGIYNAGKVDKILISGDHGTISYDEVNTIKKYLLNKNVEREDIFTDHAGFDTYDSIYRARDIFRVDSMIIITQKFHLPRAIYIANSLGLESVGIVADKRQYLARAKNTIRENGARVKAFFNVLFRAKPKFLGEVIPITGNSKDSWD